MSRAERIFRSIRSGNVKSLTTSAAGTGSGVVGTARSAGGGGSGVELTPTS